MQQNCCVDNSPWTIDHGGNNGRAFAKQGLFEDELITAFCSERTTGYGI